MQSVTIEIQPDIADKINTYIKLFGNKNLMFEKFIEFHVHRLQREINRMQAELNKYEQRYNIKTDVFYSQFDKGELGDDKDFMLWAGIYELQLDSKNKLAQLL